MYCREKHGSFGNASKEADLHVNAGKTKYLVMSQDHNAGQSHNITTDNSSFEKIDEIKYWDQP
jgi:hypothetical protein